MFFVQFVFMFLQVIARFSVDFVRCDRLNFKIFVSAQNFPGCGWICLRIGFCTEEKNFISEVYFSFSLQYSERRHDRRTHATRNSNTSVIIYLFEYIQSKTEIRQSRNVTFPPDIQILFLGKKKKKQIDKKQLLLLLLILPHNKCTNCQNHNNINKNKNYYFYGVRRVPSSSNHTN